MTVAPHPAAKDVEQSKAAELFALRAAHSLAHRGVAGLSQFETYPGPLYAVDNVGNLIFFNKACAGFFGRTPNTGVDHWCASHASRAPDGELIDPASGPVAVALRERRAGVAIEALFERPDGTRAAARTYPTPAVDENGTLHGAVNLMVPLDGVIHAEVLASVQRCRVLAKSISDARTTSVLTEMATEAEAQAHVLCPR